MHGVTNDWIHSIFDMLFLFWLVVMCLLSSLYKINICVESLAYYVWEADDDKLGFLSVVVNSFDRLFLYKRPMSFPTTKQKW